VNKEKLAIGFFDSGLGGLSVLKDALKILPNEKYIYYGDSINAPYGNRPAAKVCDLTLKGVRFLIDKGVKALVVACNTATSAAIEELRATFDIPVIGMEPAVKPAATSAHKDGEILLLATAMTLKEDKLQDLIGNLDIADHLIKVPAPKMVTLIEEEKFSEKNANLIVKEYLAKYDLTEIDAIVLGCTHFVFYRKIIKDLAGPQTQVIDGNLGTVKHLKNRLIEENLQNMENCEGPVIDFYNSDPAITSDKAWSILKKISNENNRG